MRIGLVSDVHGNVLALEAALRALRTKGVDAIYSLGDQINLGPCPRETLAMLREHGVQCLHGNHERYVLSVMAGDPAYDGINFESLRFNAALLTPEEITFPDVVQLGGATLCHAMPEDDRFPVNDVAKALPLLRARIPDEATHVICGHGHNPRFYRLGELTVCGIGSTGCMDDGVPGMACYAWAQIEGSEIVVVPEYAAYDTRPLKSLFVKSGMAQHCPVMAHIACEQMTYNHDFLVPFVTMAHAMARARGEKTISRETWMACDAVYDWPGGVSTRDFWR